MVVKFRNDLETIAVGAAVLAGGGKVVAGMTALIIVISSIASIIISVPVGLTGAAFASFFAAASAAVISAVSCVVGAAAAASPIAVMVVVVVVIMIVPMIVVAAAHIFSIFFLTFAAALLLRIAWIALADIVAGHGNFCSVQVEQGRFGDLQVQLRRQNQSGLKRHMAAVAVAVYGKFWVQQGSAGVKIEDQGRRNAAGLAWNFHAIQRKIIAARNIELLTFGTNRRLHT